MTRSSNSAFAGYGKAREDSIWSEKADSATSALRKWLTIYSINVTESKGGRFTIAEPSFNSDLRMFANNCRLQTSHRTSQDLTWGWRIYHSHTQYVCKLSDACASSDIVTS